MDDDNVVVMNPLRTVEAMDEYMLQVEAEIWGGLAEYVASGVHPDRLAAVLTRASQELLFLDSIEEEV